MDGKHFHEATRHVVGVHPKGFVFLILIVFGDLGVEPQKVHGLLTDANGAWSCVEAHLAGDKHILSENVVFNKLGSYHSSNNISCMNSYSNFKRFIINLLRLGHLRFDLLYALQHLQASGHHTIALINLDLESSLIFLNASSVAHDNVYISNSLNFINFIFYRKLVKSCKKFLQKFDNIFLKVCKLGYVNIEYRHILKLINYPLLRYKCLKLMSWYQITYKIICLRCLYVEYPLIVETFPLYHLPVMNSDAQQEEVHHLSKSKLYGLVILNSLLVVN